MIGTDKKPFSSKLNNLLQTAMTHQMKPLFEDTSPEAEAVLIELWRNMPTWQKFERVAQLNATVRTMMLSGLKERYPKADEQEIKRRLADLLLGEKLAAEVYGSLKG